MARNVAEVASAVQGVASVVQGWLSCSSRAAAASATGPATVGGATQRDMATAASGETPRNPDPTPHLDEAPGDAPGEEAGSGLGLEVGVRSDARREAAGEAPGDGRIAMGWAVNGGGRVDYQLQESELEIAHEYLAALRAHNTYFSNPDVAAFLIHEVVDSVATG